MHAPKSTAEPKSRVSSPTKEHQWVKSRGPVEGLSPQPDLLSQGSPSPSVGAHAAMLNRSRAGVGGSQRSVLQLQRQYGNRYVQRVMNIARQDKGNADVSSEVEAAIQQKRGSGQALDSKVRVQMESAFGTDFSGVRVHADGEADGLNRALSARAFTTGQDIFFRQGEYAPGSSQGKQLLAHELTHVVQQGGGLKRKLTVGEPGELRKQEAESSLQNLSPSEEEEEETLQTKPLASTITPLVQRQPDSEEEEDEDIVQSKALTTTPIQQMCDECERGQQEKSPVQPKLTLGQPGDKYEQEADRVADEVMQMPEPRLQRQVVPEPEEEEEETLQTKPLAEQIAPLVQGQINPSRTKDRADPRKKRIGKRPPIQTKNVNAQATRLVSRVSQIKPIDQGNVIQRMIQQPAEFHEVYKLNLVLKHLGNIYVTIKKVKQLGKPWNKVVERACRMAISQAEKLYQLIDKKYDLIVQIYSIRMVRIGHLWQSPISGDFFRIINRRSNELQKLIQILNRLKTLSTKHNKNIRRLNLRYGKWKVKNKYRTTLKYIREANNKVGAVVGRINAYKIILSVYKNALGLYLLSMVQNKRVRLSMLLVHHKITLNKYLGALKYRMKNPHNVPDLLKWMAK